MIGLPAAPVVLLILARAELMTIRLPLDDEDDDDDDELALLFELDDELDVVGELLLVFRFRLMRLLRVKLE